MIIISPLDSASARLWWSNAAYVSGAALTLLAAMLVFIERRLIAAGIRERAMLITEFVAVGAAIVSFFGTIGAIRYSNLVSHLKDDDLAAYKISAGVQIAQADKDSAKALSDVAAANQKAQEADLANTLLKSELAKHEGQEKEAETKLAAQGEQNNQYTHALALQQQTMEQQTHVSPELNNAQIDAVAAELKLFAGQEVIIHRTSDTVVGRLASGIANAFLRAGIKFPHYSDDIDQLYQGVTVVVHAGQGHPPLADALVNALRRQGIPVNTGAMDSVPAGAVALYLGPQ